MFENLFNSINMFGINIAIIISTVLTYYFISLNIATKKVNSNLSLMNFDPGESFSPFKKVIIGISLGIITFILYYNRVPVIGASIGIDMSYALIYLVIIYGTLSQGLTAMIVLEILKSGYRIGSDQSMPPMAWLNGILFSFLIVAFSYYLKERNYSVKKTHLIFIIGILLLRLTFFSFYLNSFFNPNKLIEFLFHLILYTALFLITTFVINIAISLSQSVQVYQTAAITDDLTGLYNRSAFNFFIDYIANLSKKENRQEFSLSIIDVDHFKYINDTYGHPVGDRILKFISEQMQHLNTPGKQYICRIGGDEFAIIHYEEPFKVEIFYKNLFKLIEKSTYTHENQPVVFSISVGITHFNDEVFDSETLIAHSDRALYEAKKQQGSHYVISDINKKP